MTPASKKQLTGMKNVLKIKTCHVTTVDITARFIILDFLKFLIKENYGVVSVCSFSKHRDFLKKEGVPLHDIKMTRRITPLADFVSFINLFLYFKKEKFDIVHTYTPKAGFLGRIAARLAGVPIVVHTSYGFYVGVAMPVWLKKTILLAEKISSHFCDLVFSQNKEDIELATREKIVDPQKIKLLTYGIDIERYNPSKFGDSFVLAKKKELGISGKKVVGMVGRFVKEKGYLDLFSAFKIIKEKVSEAVLILVAPEDKAKADALDISVLREYNIEKDAVVLGYDNEVADMEKIYPLMDVFVLPSYREGFPFSIMEASALAKPVVATDIRGCREAVENGITGKLVQLGDYKQLANEILYFLNNPGKAREMGNNGRKKAEREFDERLVFGRIKEEYQKLIEKNYEESPIISEKDF